MKGGHKYLPHDPAFDEETHICLVSGKKATPCNRKPEAMSHFGLESNFSVSEKARIIQLRN